jgi:hypothetical protein
MFQQWASSRSWVSQVPWNGTRVWSVSALSALQQRDTCEHVLFCEHAGRVETLHHMVDLLESWLEEAATDPDLLDCIAEYAYGRGGRTMEDICSGLGEPFQKMAWDQDEIGWRRFMEGMICTKMRSI